MCRTLRWRLPWGEPPAGTREGCSGGKRASLPARLEVGERTQLTRRFDRHSAQTVENLALLHSQKHLVSDVHIPLDVIKCVHLPFILCSRADSPLCWP
jgi:hypothetical protein